MIVATQQSGANCIKIIQELEKFWEKCIFPEIFHFYSWLDNKHSYILSLRWYLKNLQFLCVRFSIKTFLLRNACSYKVFNYHGYIPQKVSVKIGKVLSFYNTCLFTNKFWCTLDILRNFKKSQNVTNFFHYFVCYPLKITEICVE